MLLQEPHRFFSSHTPFLCGPSTLSSLKHTLECESQDSYFVCIKTFQINEKAFSIVSWAIKVEITSNALEMNDKSAKKKLMVKMERNSTKLILFEKFGDVFPAFLLLFSSARLQFLELSQNLKKVAGVHKLNYIWLFKQNEYECITK